MSFPGRQGRNEREEAPLVFPISKERRARIEGMAPNLRPRDEAKLGDHLDIWLDRYVLRNEQSWKIEKKDRERALERFCRKWHSEMGKLAAARQKAMVEDLHRANGFRRFEATVTGRLLVGYAQATATEVALGFHRMWGVPRIPGTALKGIARAYATLEGEGSTDELKACFGSEPETEPLERGSVAFYDALPVDGSFELAMDVLTPHHQEYYQGKQAPVEWENPIPCTFLSVVKTRFVFTVGLLPDPKGMVHVPRLEQSTNALKSALSEMGVGAKTGAGYGYFSNIIDVR